MLGSDLQSGSTSDRDRLFTAGVMAAEDAAGIELMEVKDEQSGHMPTTDTARHAPLVSNW